MVENEWRDLLDYDVQSVTGTKFDVYRTRIGNVRVCFVLEGSVIGILHLDFREGAYGNPGTLDERADDFPE